MMFPNHPAGAHVLYGRIDVNHKVLTSFRINKLFGFAKHFFIGTSGTAHGLGPALHGPRRMLGPRKAALAHAERLVLDVDAEIVAGLGVAFRRRVDPALAQASLGR